MGCVTEIRNIKCLGIRNCVVSLRIYLLKCIISVPVLGTYV